MKYSYIYEPRAIQEYEEAIFWYLERSVRAAENFESAIADKLQEICLHPTLYRNTKKYFRETFLKKYPYSIIYVIDDEKHTIVIASVFHNSRNPRKKYTT